MLKFIERIFKIREAYKTREVMQLFLLSDCPMGKELKNCPFREIRKLSHQELLEFQIKKKREFNELTDQHILCFCKRNKLKV